MYRRSTYDQDEQMLRLHIWPVIGDKDPAVVRASDIQRIIARMAEVGLSTATMGHARKVVHVLFEWLVGNGILKENPCSRIKIPKVPTSPRRSLSPAEIGALMDAMKSSRWENAVDFLIKTGLRRGEALALKWRDIDEQGWINIERALSSHMEESRPKSMASCRRFRLPRAALEVLQHQKEQLRAERIVLPNEILEAHRALPGAHFIASEYVFPARTGQQVSPRTFSRTFALVCKKANLDTSVHELRHVFVSTFGPSMDLHALQTILGHSKATHTLDIYGHLIDGALDEAADAMDAAGEVLDRKVEEARRKTSTRPNISQIISQTKKAGSR